MRTGAFGLVFEELLCTDSGPDSYRLALLLSESSSPAPETPLRKDAPHSRRGRLIHAEGRNCCRLVPRNELNSGKLSVGLHPIERDEASGTSVHIHGEEGVLHLVGGDNALKDSVELASDGGEVGADATIAE